VAREDDVRRGAARVGDGGDLLDALAPPSARVPETKRLGGAAALDNHRARALVGEVKDAARPAAREQLEEGRLAVLLQLHLAEGSARFPTRGERGHGGGNAPGSAAR